MFFALSKACVILGATKCVVPYETEKSLHYVKFKVIKRKGVSDSYLLA